ncbi:hypothetical protein TELCIR_03566 [Teladorsagia circumcincta]|uniref:Uncharacterized protein n=1 Tax=Teladorsagia circumcincta TaxID=45464 RepID=A0A2G9UW79_TELCI|nr:hypothetical protein TELCIR_03566 [Teladorsagia circumcincta]
MRFYHLMMLLCGLILCFSSVNAQFGWRCGYVGGWCGSEKWRAQEASGGFRSKARLMAALARSVEAFMEYHMRSQNAQVVLTRDIAIFVSIDYVL